MRVSTSISMIRPAAKASMSRTRSSSVLWSISSDKAQSVFGHRVRSFWLECRNHNLDGLAHDDLPQVEFTPRPGTLPNWPNPASSGLESSVLPSKRRTVSTAAAISPIWKHTTITGCSFPHESVVIPRSKMSGQANQAGRRQKTQDPNTVLVPKFRLAEGAQAKGRRPPVSLSGVGGQAEGVNQPPRASVRQRTDKAPRPFRGTRRSSLSCRLRLRGPGVRGPSVRSLTILRHRRGRPP